MTTRLVGSTYSAFTGAAYDFNAPPGTTITGLKWSGRYSRTNCTWHVRMTAYPADSDLFGVRGGQQCSINSLDIASSIGGWTAPPGTTQLRQLVVCGASSCPTGATFHSRWMEVLLDDYTAPDVSVGGALADGQWVRGAQAVRVDASDNTGVSRVEAAIPGAQPALHESTCNPTLAVPCPGSVSLDLGLQTASLSDGAHLLTVDAVDASGNPVTATKPVLVDNTPPDPIQPSIVDGEAWRPTNDFDVRWNNSAAQHAPIVAAHWEACSAERCVRGTRRAANVAALGGLTVPVPGDYTARVWLEDAAGNSRGESAISTVHMRYDPLGPNLTFEPSDPGDPLRVAITASDKHSGVGSGEIEIRRVGTSAWHGIDTKLSSPGLIAYVDDERFRNGVYEFRAHATDRAGNEASIGPKDAGAATLRLPVRATTRLRAGARRIKIKRRVVHRDGQRRTIRKRVVVLDSRVRAGFRSRVRVYGHLTNADGQPLEAATVDVLDADSRTGCWAPFRPAWTGGSATAEATRSRGIRFRYHGSKRIGAAEAVVRILVPAASTIQVDRSTVLNGDSVLFRGRVRTGPIPTAGKLIEVQAYFRRQWRTFSTVRSDSQGRWEFPYEFGGTTGSRALPLPRASAGRGRLSVRHRCVARDPRAGDWALGCEASPLCVC